MWSRPRWLDGASVGPLAVLAALNLVDEFDRIAFAALSPEIRDAFDLTDTGIVALNVVPAVMVLLSAAPIGWLADRFSRVALSLAAAVMWGTASVLTGLVPTVALLVVVRVASGVGRAANEIVHPSLLSDLYEPDVHPRVFLLHRLANPVAQTSGLLAGAIAARYGWTWAFYLLAVPTLLSAAGLAGLRDPGRRGLVGETHRDLRPAEAFRALRAVPSLRRFWATAFALAVAAFGILALASLYFEQVWGFGAAGRGLVQALLGVGWVAGVWFGGRAAQRRIDADRVEDLALICGNAFGLFVVGGLGLALSPDAAIALAFTVVLAAGNGVWQAPYFAAVARIAPPGLSGQAYGSSLVVYAVGGTGALVVGAVADATSHRVGFVLVAVAGLAAAVLARSLAPLIRHDLRSPDGPAGG